MICDHLRDVEQALRASGIRETFRGTAWSQNCREWVYFACYLDLGELRQRYSLADYVVDHEHRGTHDGQERGLVCSKCHDAIMGSFDPAAGLPVFPTRE